MHRNLVDPEIESEALSMVANTRSVPAVFAISADLIKLGTQQASLL